MKYLFLCSTATLFSFFAKAQTGIGGGDRKDTVEKTTALKTTTTKKSTVLFGVASYYADKFNGRETANGEVYDGSKFTAACNQLPMGTWIRVTNLNNNRSVIVKTNDRLHISNPRVLDLSKAAAEKLGYVGRGLTKVKVEVLERK
jgi:rare lipoprotein A